MVERDIPKWNNFCPKLFLSGIIRERKRMINGWLFWLFLAGVVAAATSSEVTAAAANYTANYSSLPLNTSLTMNLTLPLNISINLTAGRFMTPDATNILLYEGSYNLTVAIFIPFGTAPINYTDQITLFAENNSQSNYSEVIQADLYILDDRPQPETDYIQLDINEWEYVICDFLLADGWNSTKSLVIVGTPSREVHAQFNPTFFNLSPTFNITGDNYSIVDIQIHLPANLPLGSYNEVISFDLEGEFTNATFHFTIIDCVPPPPQYDDMVLLCSKINKTPEEFVECTRLQAEYYAGIYKSMLEAQEKKVVNHTVIEYQNRTDYLPVLPLDNPDTIRAIQQLPAEISLLINELSAAKKTDGEKDAAINELTAAKNNATLAAQKAEQEKLIALEKAGELVEETKKKYERGHVAVGTLTAWLIALLACAGVGYGYYQYEANTLW